MQSSFYTKIFLLLSTNFLSFCLLHAQQNEWTWMKGSSGSNGPANYGTLGVASASNTPGALYEATQWTDQHGNFWLFGGLKDFGSEYNTLWKFDPATNEWTWMKGSSNCCQAGVYGTLGVPSSANTPGSRAWGSWAWVDTAGNFWLYGGIGNDLFGGYQVLSDLWKYDVVTNEWTWMDGPSSATVAVDYGTLGTPTSTTSPGARAESDAAWVDDSSRLWLFGGALYFPQMGGWSIGGFGNDMWMWDPGIGEWTWMQGTQALSGPGAYGTIGIPDSSNYPPGRGSYCNWKDSAGNFYFFGGYNLSKCWNDMWQYDWHNNVFTWISGPSSANGLGTYGTLGIPDINNIPPARYENRCFWQDHCGGFWLWGGAHTGGSVFNDLWNYNPSSNEWTWVSGENSGNFIGVFGTQGVSDPSNEPPAKYGSVGWVDSVGNLWMFGGGVPGFTGAMNDLWRYVPDSTYCGPVQNPAVGFAVSDAELCEKFCTSFFDSSTNNPVSWQWLFPGGSPSSSTDQNPTGICYAVPGVYDVTLITTNINGSDTLILQNYITVFATPPFPSITQAGYILTASAGYSYQWQFNSADIPGATNQSYTILQSGLYTVIVGDSNGCVNSASTEVLISGMEDISNGSAIFIAPNPSDGLFTIEGLNGIDCDEASIHVRNTFGQILFASEQMISSANRKIQVNLSNSLPAFYFIEITCGNIFFVRKILIQ
ncbi:MAG: kelch repeat-containing protein [Chitinophagales bacterium]